MSPVAWGDDGLIDQSRRGFQGLRTRLMVLRTKLADAPAMVDAVERVYRGTWLVTPSALADLTMAKDLSADRVMGCIITGRSANLTGPGAMQRRRSEGGPPTVRLGGTQGPASPRIHALVERLSGIDGTEAVDDMVAISTISSIIAERHAEFLTLIRNAIGRHLKRDLPPVCG